MTIRLFVEEALAPDTEISLPPGAARHAQVRRVQPGDELQLFDGHGADWPAQVLSMGRHEVRVRVGQPMALDCELRWPVTIAVGMPANERMDTLVEKATELGVAAIQPLVCERSVLRLDGERAARKQAHWQAIAQAACEQCGRARVPVVTAVLPLARWLAQPRGEAVQLLLSPNADSVPLAQRLTHPGPLVSLSGPEGGLSPSEASAAQAAGFLPTGLGPRVLRADTAPLALLAFVGLGA